MGTLEYAPRVSIPCSGRVLERLTHLAAQYEYKTAVHFGEEAISYGQLVNRIDVLAAHLTASGIGTDDLVGIGMSRSLDMVIAILGVWKAGAAYVPLDPDYPELRLAQILEDATPKILITDRRNQQRMTYPNVASVVFDHSFTCDAAPCFNTPSLADALAYVMFTSGSTGRAKGVQISHGALANFMTGIQHSLQIQPLNTLIANSTLSFDAT